MTRATLTLIVVMSCATALSSQSARAQGYLYFPSYRVYENEFLRPTFRLPVEVLLEADTPQQLAQRSAGTVPTFAAAPVVASPKNPFDGAASIAGASEEITGVDPDPFASTATEEPGQAAGASDPFASDSPATATGSDPFADPRAASGDSEADPFADSDPFADF